jgi:hypothetical protein
MGGEMIDPIEIKQAYAPGTSAHDMIHTLCDEIMVLRRRARLHLLSPNMVLKRHVEVIGFAKDRPNDYWSFTDIMAHIKMRRGTLYAILARLRSLGYIDRTDKAFQSKHWYATDKLRTTSTDKVVEDYEMYMLVRLSVRDLK